MIGQTISHYEILEKLGQGGMGVVYKAHDTNLDRDVALKFLPHHATMNKTEQARFLQEAKAAAALNHPNICTIYGIDEVEGKHFIVMEFVDGQTLQEKKSSLSINQAIDIGIQVAEGLAAAHEKGIVHRDIKPENIMIRKDGIAQIMDFGLAKLRGASRLTKEGSTVGTVGYMSPEQVQGQDVDYRSDIFSLGVVMYELLAGESPFKGIHEAAIIYEIVNVEPQPISHFGKWIDQQLDAIILECLEKDKSERCQSAKELAKDLRRIKKSTKKSHVYTIGTQAGQRQVSGSSGSVVTEGLGKRFDSRKTLAVVSACGILAALVFAFLYVAGPTPENDPIQFTISPPEGTSIEPESPAVSPDGRTIAFAARDSTGTSSLWLRPLESKRATRLEGTENATYPFWSYNNRFLCFFAHGKLNILNLSTRTVQALCDAPHGLGGTWGSRDVILFTPGGFVSSISGIRPDGGTPTAVTTLDIAEGEELHYLPQFLPDGRHFVYSVFSRTSGNSAFYVASIDDHSRTKIKSFAPGFSNISNKIGVAPPDWFFFVRNNSLMQQQFDPSTYRLLKAPVPLMSDVRHFAVSSTVILASQSGAKNLLSTLVLFDRRGRRLHVDGNLGLFWEMSVSPDENNVAYHCVYRLENEESYNQDIWIMDRNRGVTSRLTSDPAADVSPVWSPDGKDVVYASSLDSVYDLYEKRVHSNAEAQLLLRSDMDKYPLDWSPDSKYLLYQTRNRLWVLPMVGDRKPFQYLQVPFEQGDATFSPDSKWVAYTSMESGKAEVYLQSFPNAQQKWQLSKNGGRSPRWRQDGKELYYYSPSGQLMAVEIKTSPSVTIGIPKALFGVHLMDISNMYSVLDNGNRFLVNEVSSHYTPEPINVVVNWKSLLHTQ